MGVATYTITRGAQEQDGFATLSKFCPLQSQEAQNFAPSIPGGSIKHGMEGGDVGGMDEDADEDDVEVQNSGPAGLPSNRSAVEVTVVDRKRSESSLGPAGLPSNWSAVEVTVVDQKRGMHFLHARAQRTLSNLELALV